MNEFGACAGRRLPQRRVPLGDGRRPRPAEPRQNVFLHLTPLQDPSSSESRPSLQGPSAAFGPAARRLRKLLHPSKERGGDPGGARRGGGGRFRGTKIGKRRLRRPERDTPSSGTPPETQRPLESSPSRPATGPSHLKSRTKCRYHSLWNTPSGSSRCFVARNASMPG